MMDILTCKKYVQNGEKQRITKHLYYIGKSEDNKTHYFCSESYIYNLTCSEKKFEDFMNYILEKYPDEKFADAEMIKEIYRNWKNSK